MGRPKKHTEEMATITVRVESRQIPLLAELVEHYGTDRSDVVRRLIDRGYAGMRPARQATPDPKGGR
ncbi:MAG: hypothetical protein ACRDXE_10455 [Acidimicrobiales bacterium]